MRAASQAVIVAAVAGAVAALRRRAGRAQQSPPEPVVVPAQRRSELEELGLQVEDLAVAEHDAQDARLFDALDWSVS